MNQKKITQMRQRYTTFFGEEPLRLGVIADLESTLGLILPDDMKSITQFYSGGIVGGISHNAFDSIGPATNIVNETQRLRSGIDLPHRFVVLAEPDESLIVLDVDSGAVTWCGYFDVSRLGDSSKMLGKPSTWPSYADFFEHLLDIEGEERGE
jgi:hypothetical protein